LITADRYQHTGVKPYSKEIAMQHNVIVGRLLTQPVLVVKDDTQYCRFTIVELKKRKGVQTKIEYVAFDAAAKFIADKHMVGDTVCVTYTITNTSYECDGVNHHGYQFQATMMEFVSAGKQRKEQQVQRAGRN
jgi:hypothetical protein